MANKKIVVLKLRELIYTGIFLFFGIVLILLMVAMFSGGKSDESTDNPPDAGVTSSREDSKGTDPADSGSADTEEVTQTFLPGIYTSDFNLSGNTFTLQLLVDADRVKSVDLLSLQTDASGTGSDEYIATMYPLMEPALEIIESSLSEGIPLSEITFSVENQYTGSLLVQALDELMEKAQPSAD